jgi:all-trans-retinol 13,14-reductase
MTYDYVVIGAGVSGISTSLLLAGAGYRVALVEKASRTAATVRGFSRRGVQFDTGFHYAGALGEGEALDVFFRYLGLATRLEKAPLDAEGFDTVRCRRPDFEFRFPAGTERLRSRLHQVFPEERYAIDGYLQQVEQVCTAFPFLNLDAETSEIAGGGLQQGPTLQEVLDRLTGNALLKSVLSVHCLLYGVLPHEVSFTLHALVAGPYYRSAHTFKGGGGSLAVAFDQELAQRGVEVFCSQGAEAILLGSDGRPSAVRLSGGATLSCRGCVATVHPRILLELLPEGVFRPAYRKRLMALEETLSACLLFGMGSGPAFARLRQGNLFLIEEPETVGNLTGLLPESAPLYLTAAQRKGGPDGLDGFMAILPVAGDLTSSWAGSRRGERPADYLVFKDMMVEKMQKRLSYSCPELAAAISWREGATPLTMRDYAHSPFGSLYGVKHRVGQFNPQPATKVPELWLAGQAVAAPGVMGAITSAFLACGKIVGQERIHKELQACR